VADVTIQSGRPLAALHRSRPARPAEGWVVAGLHLAIVLLATGTVTGGDWVTGDGNLAIVAVVAVLGGASLAKSGILDMLSHLVAFWTGIGAAWLVTATAFPALGANLPDRMVSVADRARVWLAATPGPGPDEGGVLLLGTVVFTTWVGAYASAWVLYRRGWPLGSIVLPAVAIFTALGIRPGSGVAPLAGLAIGAVFLLGAHFGFQRRLAWRGRPGMTALPVARWLGPALPLAVTAVLVIATLPPRFRDDGLDAAARAIEEPLGQVQGWTERVLGRFDRGDPDTSRTFSQFDDRFELGGALELSDEPAAVLRAGGPAYLAAYRYDHYDGAGWESSVDDTFLGQTDEGQRYSPRMRFAPDQAVVLSGVVDRERAPVTGQIEMLRAEDDLVLTLDTHQEATIPTTVQLSWRQLDGARFAIDDGERLPPDLRRLANLLREANSRGYLSGDAGSLTGDPALDTGLTRERDQLGERLLNVDWQPGPDREVGAIVVSGQLPVYDDVEAVFGRQDMEDQPYTVTGQASTASPDQLATAGTEYPAWVTARYLQLPGTVTAQTRSLAAQIARDAGATTPFAVAVALQDDLRGRIRYVEDIAEPPEGRDVVDFVLFETREGYCEYYASAMVVMLRSLDIPARIVAGYYPAAYDEASAGFLYRQRNAHAWVEVFIPAYGWIAFEPTASQPARAYGEPGDPALTPTSAPSPTPAALPTQAPTPRAAPTATAAAAGAVDATDGDGDGSGAVARWIVRGVGIGLGVAGLAAATVVLAWRRGLGGLSPLAAHWARVRKAGRWAGVTGDLTMTPNEYADALGRAVPRSLAPARQVAESYTRERYGPPGAVSSDTGQARQAWHETRRAMVRAWARRSGRHRS